MGRGLGNDNPTIIANTKRNIRVQVLLLRESKGVVITGNVKGATVSVLMIHDHPNRLHTGCHLAKPRQFSNNFQMSKAPSTIWEPFYVVLINLCTLLHNDGQSPVETRHLPANVDVSSRFHIGFMMFHHENAAKSNRNYCSLDPFVPSYTIFSQNQN